jgi:3-methyladenine DNA glycosylase AlkD
MNVCRFLKDYDVYLKNYFNLEKAKNEKRYLYSDLKHFGISVPKISKFLKTHKSFLKSLSRKNMLDLVLKLWSQSVFEKKHLALNILKENKDKLEYKDLKLVEKLMKESKGWALLDNLIIPLMPYFINLNKNTYSYLKKWIKDKNFWVRRSALLAQLLFFRKGRGGDKKLFFKFARSQANEAWIDKIYKNKLENRRAKFFIRKAIGWSLREMSAKDPLSVVKFLNENKNRLSGLSFREGSRKLEKKHLKLLKD